MKKEFDDLDDIENDSEKVEESSNINPECTLIDALFSIKIIEMWINKFRRF